MELLPLAIGIGLVLSIVFTEAFGLAAGGMVVPGYVALFLTRPLSLALTLAVAFATYLLVRAASSFTIIYGKRRTALMVLVGFVLGIAANALAADALVSGEPAANVIGFIIPGLIAIWLDRQGIVETLCSLATVSVVVRLVLILIVGEALLTP